MAGDLGFAEVLLSAGSGAASLSPVPILHEYGSIQIGFGSAGGLALSPSLDAALNENERFGLDAFHLRESEAFLHQKRDRTGRSMSWSGSDELQGLHLGRAASPLAGGGAATAPMASPLTPSSSRRLQGRIGVGIVLVSGPGAMTLSRPEQIHIVAQVQNGLSWLAAQSPAKDVTFVNDVKPVNVTSADVKGGTSFEQCERQWRDDALHALGHSAGMVGLDALVADLRASLRVRHAFVAFFTKYSLFHFAYALTGPHPYLVMDPRNDGWGTNNLDSVFAHETCHIFGAPDEYSRSGCNCGGSWGHFGVPNINCETCAEGGSVDCIMRANTLAMCKATPYHVGFNGLPPWTAPAAGRVVSVASP